MAVNESAGISNISAVNITASSEVRQKQTTINKELKSVSPNDAELQKYAGLSNTEMVVSSLVAGAAAGALAKTTIAPLDRTKINFQIRKSAFSARSAIEFLLKTLRTEGVLALWRGNSATMARIVPYAAIQFTSHEQWKKALGVSDIERAQSHPLRLFVAGSLAGVTSQSLTYPLDLARARMAVTTHVEYSTLRSVFVHIVRYEGVRTLYRGYGATVLGVVPYAGVSFFTYDSLKHAYQDYFGQKQPAMVNLLFGGVAGMLGQSSSYPLDIVRRRMQTTKRNPDGTYPYGTILGTLKKVYVEEGIKKGFFKGLSMNWVKGPIAVGISFATYDYIKLRLRDVALTVHTGDKSQIDR